MKTQKNTFQMKEQDKTPGELTDMEKWNRPKKEFRVMMVKMTKGLRRMDAQSEKLEVFKQRIRNYKEKPNTIKEYNN